MKLIDGYISYDNKDSEENPYEIERLQLMVKITRILDLLDKGNDELDKVLSENRELNSDMLQKIEIAVTKSNYNEYFEDIVAKITARLSGINNRMKTTYCENYSHDKTLSLQEIKGIYTMESERKIHELMVSGNEPEDTPDLINNENDIEFF
jgi:hypothetical protein